MQKSVWGVIRRNSTESFEDFLNRSAEVLTNTESDQAILVTEGKKKGIIYRFNSNVRNPIGHRSQLNEETLYESSSIQKGGTYDTLTGGIKRNR